MAGPMVMVDTQIAAINLNVSRQLGMGIALLRLYVRDEIALNGLRVIRDYDTSFDRIPEVEKEIGDGSTVVVDIADFGFPEGQLRADLTEAKFFQFVLGDTLSELYEMNEIPNPAFNEAQVYRITSGSTQLKKTYVRVGKR